MCRKNMLLILYVWEQNHNENLKNPRLMKWQQMLHLLSQEYM